MFNRTELTDLLKLSQSFEAFAWEDWTQQGNGTWKSPGGRVLSDPVFQRMKASGAAEPKATRVGRAKDAVVGAARAVAGTKVGRAVVTADRAAGRKAGAVAGKVIDWKKRQAVRLQSAMAEGKLGQAMAWASGTEVGRRTVQELERRAQRVEQTVREMGTDGLTMAKARGAKRVLRYVYSKFLANRRRYGLLPAVAIEATVIGLTQVLPRAVMAAGGLAAAAVGSAGGPGGAIAAGLGGWAASNTLLSWTGQRLFGKLAPTLVRAAAESSAAWIARRVREPSGVRMRLAEQRRATAEQLGASVPAPAVLPPVPRATFSEGGPPTMEDVAGEIGQRLRELGVEVPPAEELLRAVGAVFEAIVAG